MILFKNVVKRVRDIPQTLKLLHVHATVKMCPLILLNTHRTLNRLGQLEAILRTTIFQLLIITRCEISCAIFDRYTFEFYSCDKKYETDFSLKRVISLILKSFDVRSSRPPPSSISLNFQ